MLAMQSAGVRAASGLPRPGPEFIAQVSSVDRPLGAALIAAGLDAARETLHTSRSKTPSRKENRMPVSTKEPYDDNNIFARILRGEIPCKKIYEDEHVLAFHDIRPQAPVHALVIPKGRYVSFADFAATAGAEEIAAFFRATAKIARELGVEESGYRAICNIGPDSHQEVPHFHIHIMGGRPLGHMLVPQR